MPLPAALEGQPARIHNDLDAAIEVSFRGARHILYPGRGLEIGEASESIAVQLRDDPRVNGALCTGPATSEGAVFSAADSFGMFGSQARTWIQQDQREVHEEARNRRRREEDLEKMEARARKFVARFRARTCAQLTFVLLLYMPLTCMMAFLDRTFFDPNHRHKDDEIRLLQVGCFIFFLISLLCLGYFLSKRFLELSWVLAAQALLAAVNAWALLSWAAFSVRSLLVEEIRPWLEIVITAPILSPPLAMSCWRHYVLLHRKAALEIVAHYEEEETAAVRRAREQTIRFLGRVLPGHGRPCVCSWPGKYVTAWDELVQRSREGTSSAAVVFLPEDTEDYGLHDPVPGSENLLGDCWCTTLYGQPQPWGCRWWTKWLANIEEAVSQEAALQVYFFRGLKGQGKVQNFLTAGAEYLRREGLIARRDEFKGTTAYKEAVAAGLGTLPQEPRRDGSSAHSRELDRLFLSWLPVADRQFLEASEGLGNSQKAEVAWLERKGYKYTEVEVDTAEWFPDGPAFLNP